MPALNERTKSPEIMLKEKNKIVIIERKPFKKTLEVIR
jgi:hypothetical protein